MSTPRHFAAAIERHLWLVAVVIGTTNLGAQAPPDAGLGVRRWRTTADFSEINRVYLHSDGSVFVIDVEGLARTVRRVDPAGATIRSIGRNGAGPGEYREPSALVPFAGDSVAVVDPPGRRILLLAADGRVGRTIPVERPPPDAWIRGPIAGHDRAGMVYYDAQQFDLDRRGLAAVGMLLRRPLLGSDEHRVRLLHFRRPDQVGTGPRPYPFRDGWAVSDDGVVAHVSAEPYRIWWWRSGRLVDSTPVLSYPRVPVGPGDRRAYERWWANLPSVGMGRAGASVGAPTSRIDPALYPQTLPPLPAEGSPVVIDPWNRVWVTRLHRLGVGQDTVEVYQMGADIPTKVTLPAGRRLLAASRGGILLEAADQDGLAALELYSWPAPGIRRE
ncbi:MAG: hypothetical protein SFU84_15155 [Gemmatimonadales bacterium]|nr:hypothetical protein [Gemmatimonadales bacterium]